MNEDRRSNTDRQPRSFRERVWEKHPHWCYRKHESCPGKIRLMDFFPLLSLLPLPPGKSSSLERRHLRDGVTQTVIKSGRKRCFALSRGLVFIRSGTHRGAKHNSEVVVKLFTLPLCISVIYGLHRGEQEDHAMPKSALCTADLNVVLRIKVSSRWSFPTSRPFKL